MSKKVNEVVAKAGPNDKVLVVAGRGHVMFHKGVPERVYAQNPSLAEDSALIVCQEVERDCDMNKASSLIAEVENSYGPKGSNPADFIYLYQSVEDQLMSSSPVKSGPTTMLASNVTQ